MPKFSYTAMDAQGKEKKGHVDADTEANAAIKLKDQGLFPTNIQAAGTGAGIMGKKKKQQAKQQRGGGSGRSTVMENLLHGKPKLTSKQLCAFTRQVATLLDAGLPLVRSLRTLEKQAREAPARRLIADVANTVESGATLSEAMNNNSGTFDRLYVNMVRAGEASGSLEGVLGRLADFMEKAARLRRKVKGALTYPVVVLVIALTITGGLMVFIVPKFAKTFQDMLGNEPLPGLTIFVMNISHFMIAKWYLGVLGVAALVGAFVLIKKTKTGGYLFDLTAIKTPPFAGLVTKSSVARFGSTLGTLLDAGVSMLQALQIVRDTSGNQVIANAVQVVHDAVKDGEGMSKPLEQTEVFPAMMVSMVEVGEETGELPNMLARVALVYEEEVDATVENITALIEPAMILFLAVVIGTIVIALFMPMIKLIEKL